MFFSYWKDSNCGTDKIRCLSGNSCVRMNNVCDGRKHCSSDNSDEDEVFCKVKNLDFSSVFCLLAYKDNSGSL